MYVYFDIDEATWLKALRHTRSGQNPPVVNMGLTTDNGLPYQGVLDFMGNQMNRSTGTIRARAVIPDPTECFSRPACLNQFAHRRAAGNRAD